MSERLIQPSAYREYPAAPDLRDVVACTWTTVSRPSGRAGKQPIIPDGCADIIIFGEEPAHVAGPASVTQWIVRPAQGVRITGLRLRPGAVRAVLGCSAEALSNRDTPVADICGRAARPLLAALAAEQDQTVRRLALEAWTRGRLAAARQRDDGLVMRAAGLLTRDPHLRVDRLTAKFDISPRRLHREFVAAVGYGPKALQKIMRLQMALRIADGGRAPLGLAELAAAAGYADQSHMTRDFQALTGFTPAQYLAVADPNVGQWLTT